MRVLAPRIRASSERWSRRSRWLRIAWSASASSPSSASTVSASAAAIASSAFASNRRSRRSGSRREEQLAEDECDPGADQRVGQPLVPDFAVRDGDGEDGADRGLCADDPRAAEHAREHERDEGASASEP